VRSATDIRTRLTRANALLNIPVASSVIATAMAEQGGLGIRRP
jgi:IMP dehydrogenase/GMP reductase